MLRSVLRRKAAVVTSPASPSEFRQMLRYPKSSQGPEDVVMVVATAEHVKKRTQQLIETVEENYPKLRIMTVDILKQPEHTASISVLNVPTVQLWHGGLMQRVITGGDPAAALDHLNRWFKQDFLPSTSYTEARSRLYEAVGQSDAEGLKGDSGALRQFESMLSFKKATGFAELADHQLAARGRLHVYASRDGVSDQLREAVGAYLSSPEDGEVLAECADTFLREYAGWFCQQSPIKVLNMEEHESHQVPQREILIAFLQDLDWDRFPDILHDTLFKLQYLIDKEDTLFMKMSANSFSVSFAYSRVSRVDTLCDGQTESGVAEALTKAIQIGEPGRMVMRVPCLLREDEMQNLGMPHQSGAGMSGLGGGHPHFLFDDAFDRDERGQPK
ncbi:WD repeat-containing protein 33, partial [Perkinsus olseni]